jgi:putative intracellular protease/amidase
MAKSGEPRILQIAIPIYNGITALDAIGPYNVLQLLPNVNIVFVSHSKGLYRDGVLAIEASASFDEVVIPNPVHV